MDHSGGAFQALHPVQTQRASEAIYEQIRQLILNGDLKPGDRLPSERNMMEMMQRSRPTIREALRMLERDGFIKTVAGSQGAVVQTPSTKNAEQSLQALMMTNSITLENLAEMRSVTEPAIARLAAIRRSEEDLAYLQDLLEKQAAAIYDPQAFIPLDLMFHDALGRATKNELWMIITRVTTRQIEDSLRVRMRVISIEDRERMCRKILSLHTGVVEAITRSDADGAEKAMLAHTEAFLKDAPVNGKVNWDDE